MILIGLTGGIGSGKSTVSRLLAERGCVIIDGDQIARDLQVPHGPAIAPLAERFPDAVTDGVLDRQKLAGIVFNDPEQLAALNAIMLPLINEGIMREIESRRASTDLVVLDMPLLAEFPRRDLSGIVARMSKQASRQDRLAIADRVISNDSSLEDLTRQVEECVEWARTLPPAGPRAGEPIRK